MDVTKGTTFAQLANPVSSHARGHEPSHVVNARKIGSSVGVTVFDEGARPPTPPVVVRRAPRTKTAFVRRVRGPAVDAQGRTGSQEILSHRSGRRHSRDLLQEVMNSLPESPAKSFEEKMDDIHEKASGVKTSGKKKRRSPAKKTPWAQRRTHDGRGRVVARSTRARRELEADDNAKSPTPSPRPLVEDVEVEDQEEEQVTPEAPAESKSKRPVPESRTLRRLREEERRKREARQAEKDRRDRAKRELSDRVQRIQQEDRERKREERERLQQETDESAAASQTENLLVRARQERAQAEREKARAYTLVLKERERKRKEEERKAREEEERKRQEKKKKRDAEEAERRQRIREELQRKRPRPKPSSEAAVAPDRGPPAGSQSEEPELMDDFQAIMSKYQKAPAQAGGGADEAPHQASGSQDAAAAPAPVVREDSHFSVHAAASAPVHASKSKLPVWEVERRQKKRQAELKAEQERQEKEARAEEYERKREEGQKLVQEQRRKWAREQKEKEEREKEAEEKRRLELAEIQEYTIQQRKKIEEQRKEDQERRKRERAEKKAREAEEKEHQRNARLLEIEARRKRIRERQLAHERFMATHPEERKLFGLPSHEEKEVSEEGEPIEEPDWTEGVDTSRIVAADDDEGSLTGWEQEPSPIVPLSAPVIEDGSEDERDDGMEDVEEPEEVLAVEDEAAAEEAPVTPPPEEPEGHGDDAFDVEPDSEPRAPEPVVPVVRGLTADAIHAALEERLQELGLVNVEEELSASDVSDTASESTASYEWQKDLHRALQELEEKQSLMEKEQEEEVAAIRTQQEEHRKKEEQAMIDAWEDDPNDDGEVENSFLAQMRELDGDIRRDRMRQGKERIQELTRRLEVLTAEIDEEEQARERAHDEEMRRQHLESRRQIEREVAEERAKMAREQEAREKRLEEIYKKEQKREQEKHRKEQEKLKEAQRKQAASASKKKKKKGQDVTFSMIDLSNEFQSFKEKLEAERAGVKAGGFEGLDAVQRAQSGESEPTPSKAVVKESKQQQTSPSLDKDVVESEEFAVSHVPLEDQAASSLSPAAESPPRNQHARAIRQIFASLGLPGDQDAASSTSEPPEPDQGLSVVDLYARDLLLAQKAEARERALEQQRLVEEERAKACATPPPGPALPEGVGSPLSLALSLAPKPSPPIAHAPVQRVSPAGIDYADDFESDIEPAADVAKESDKSWKKPSPLNQLETTTKDESSTDVEPPPTPATRERDEADYWGVEESPQQGDSEGPSESTPVAPLRTAFVPEEDSPVAPSPTESEKELRRERARLHVETLPAERTGKDRNLSASALERRLHAQIDLMDNLGDAHMQLGVLEFERERQLLARQSAALSHTLEIQRREHQHALELAATQEKHETALTRVTSLFLEELANQRKTRESDATLVAPQAAPSILTDQTDAAVDDVLNQRTQAAEDRAALELQNIGSQLQPSGIVADEPEALPPQVRLVRLRLAAESAEIARTRSEWVAIRTDRLNEAEAARDPEQAQAAKRQMTDVANELVEEQKRIVRDLLSEIDMYRHALRESEVEQIETIEEPQPSESAAAVDSLPVEAPTAVEVEEPHAAADSDEAIVSEPESQEPDEALVAPVSPVKEEVSAAGDTTEDEIPEDIEVGAAKQAVATAPPPSPPSPVQAEVSEVSSVEDEVPPPVPVSPASSVSSVYDEEIPDVATAIHAVDADRTEQQAVILAERLVEKGLDIEDQTHEDIVDDVSDHADVIEDVAETPVVEEEPADDMDLDEGVADVTEYLAGVDESWEESRWKHEVDKSAAAPAAPPATADVSDDSIAEDIEEPVSAIEDEAGPKSGEEADSIGEVESIGEVDSISEVESIEGAVAAEATGKAAPAAEQEGGPKAESPSTAGAEEVAAQAKDEAPQDIQDVSVSDMSSIDESISSEIEEALEEEDDVQPQVREETLPEAVKEKLAVAQPLAGGKALPPLRGVKTLPPLQGGAAVLPPAAAAPVASSVSPVPAEEEEEEDLYDFEDESEEAGPQAAGKQSDAQRDITVSQVESRIYDDLLQGALSGVDQVMARRQQRRGAPVVQPALTVLDSGPAVPSPSKLEDTKMEHAAPPSTGPTLPADVKKKSPPPVPPKPSADAMSKLPPLPLPKKPPKPVARTADEIEDAEVSIDSSPEATRTFIKDLFRHADLMKLANVEDLCNSLPTPLSMDAFEAAQADWVGNAREREAAKLKDIRKVLSKPLSDKEKKDTKKRVDLRMKRRRTRLVETLKRQRNFQQSIWAAANEVIVAIVRTNFGGVGPTSRVFGCRLGPQVSKQGANAAPLPASFVLRGPDYHDALAAAIPLPVSATPKDSASTPVDPLSSSAKGATAANGTVTKTRPRTMNAVVRQTEDAVLHLMDVSVWGDQMEGALVMDVRLQEALWIQYNTEEYEAKCELSDFIFDDLLSDTISALNNVEKRRDLRRQRKLAGK